MMLNFLKNRSVAGSLFLFLFALHFIVMQGGVSKSVLCIGADGHIDLKLSSDGSTCNFLTDPEAKDTQRIVTSLWESSSRIHCSDCVDLPGIQSVRHFEKLRSKSVNIPASQPEIVFTLSDNTATNGIAAVSYVSGYFPPYNPPLNSHNTIVLLI